VRSTTGNSFVVSGVYQVDLGDISPCGTFTHVDSAATGTVSSVRAIAVSGIERA
jgi:hypothetical protein